MGPAFYIVIVIAAALLGVVLGWRRGLLAQTGSLLGVAFGVGGVRILLPDFLPTVERWCAGYTQGPYPLYLTAAVGTAVIFFSALLLFGLAGLVIDRIVRVLAVRPWDNILGAFFGLFKWLMSVSVAFNMLLGMSQEGALWHLTACGDGNPVELVMDISPAITGTPSPDALHHRAQLIEARSISQLLAEENNEPAEGV